jgi:hypothetical protein
MSTRREAATIAFALAMCAGAPSARRVVARDVVSAPISREPTVAEFVARARVGTSRYADQQAAIDAGFLRVGVDFPAMGEHWVSLERIMADTLDPARPSMLTYVRIGGVPTLAGVAYTALLEPGDALPPFAAAKPFWHEHNGTVVEESFPLAESARPVDPDETHLAILHAWVWMENPDGVFTTDNWSLPYVRLGVPRPPHPAPELAGALSLGAGTAEYYLLAARNAGQLSDAQAQHAERVLRAGAERMVEDLAPVRARGVIDAGDERLLVARWHALWDAVAAVAPDRAAAFVGLARGAGGTHASPHQSPH